MKLCQFFFCFVASLGKDKTAIGMDWNETESSIPWTPDFSNLIESIENTDQNCNFIPYISDVI